MADQPATTEDAVDRDSRIARAAPEAVARQLQDEMRSAVESIRSSASEPPELDP
jgi:hypothetical protein